MWSGAPAEPWGDSWWPQTSPSPPRSPSPCHQAWGEKSDTGQKSVDSVLYPVATSYKLKFNSWMSSIVIPSFCKLKSVFNIWWEWNITVWLSLGTKTAGLGLGPKHSGQHLGYVKRSKPCSSLHPGYENGLKWKTYERLGTDVNGGWNIIYCSSNSISVTFLQMTGSRLTILLIFSFYMKRNVRNPTADVC